MQPVENSDAPLSAQPIEVTVEARAHGWRVDHYLARLYPNYSRALFQKAIGQQAVLVNGLAVKASRRLRVNDVLSVRLPEAADQTLPPEDLPLEIIYEDESLVVINKAAGMITHPGKANYRGTLAGALQFHFDSLSDVAGKLRPGIVHRLDRDTSGLIVVAKDNQVHHAISRQFERREVTKEYRAIVWGVVERDADLIRTYLRVNPKRREAMMVCDEGGNAREAVTRYEVIARFYDFSYLRFLPRTGRTHQLRVHARHLGHPIVADRLYGGRAALTRQYLAGAVEARALRRKSIDAPASEDSDVLIRRQALHAYRLEFRHPATGKPLQFTAPLPPDMENTLSALRSPALPNML
ncbi:MAG: RluA family pseudouridine synthase [Planctomycetia bacterium]|nr:RluA family pseudouridine synthase [Planctomycetia bacterium]